MKPDGKLRNVIHRNQRGDRSQPRILRQTPAHARHSMRRPIPTIMRKEKKGISIGGRRSRGTVAIPGSSEVKLPVSTKLLVEVTLVVRIGPGEQDESRRL